MNETDFKCSSASGTGCLSSRKIIAVAGGDYDVDPLPARATSKYTASASPRRLTLASGATST